ncbi:MULTISPECIES: aldehyde dehydrogenase family protein [Amycolatopsis]|uniref:Aldehyde dehydrogenase n=1 Tax=Amycolatopsis dendrobii TaxID=2760662 RepID=A0A7W3ZCB4_9PSEU|nr:MULTISPECIES: aldehyde dehydrogenase family protein [Amycolatopsis]MBB1155757.1 aldehyde dehydrogenase family protein [Amycolatopsis dendrobii]UKD52960.1 aldehyde dehydrogenase family protein [Amycolatopsis sp. FU40]
MTAVQPKPTPVGETFDSLSPATDEVVGTYPVHTAEQVNAAVERARAAARWWDGLGFAGRAERLQRWKGVLTRRLPQLCQVVRDETGKPIADAQLESVLAIEHIAWAAKNARKVLGKHRRSSGLLMANQAATVEYLPLGVVGVIGPWNYPVFTPLGSIAYALAAGNAVVFKPSEYTPGVGKWLVDAFAEIVPEQPVLQLITGFGETGAALVGSGVDKIAFTGSAATGKKIMAAAANTLTPVVIEAGGKDALLVDTDADLEAAADATVWGAFSNSGQTCIGVERVYVHERVADEFVARVVEKAKNVRAGSDEDAQYGPITMPSQLSVIRSHIEDALKRGGKALVGGVESVGDRYVQPTVLVDVPEDSEAVREETFGPTVTIARVRDMDEAIEKANATKYGLGSTVFSRARGAELASRLRAGMTSVNAPLSFAGIASLPFGGVGDSGFGRIHGPEGLREFARPKAVARQRFTAPLTLTSFSRKESTDALVAKLVTVLHGKR